MCHKQKYLGSGIDKVGQVANFVKESLELLAEN